MLVRTIIASVASLGLALGVISGEAFAQMGKMSAAEPPQTTQFRRVEQPLWVKGAVTMGGLALVVWELWWFLLSKPKSQKAEARQGIQEITITVDGGYEPSHVIVSAGQPVRLNFFRKDPSSCLEEVRLADFHINQELSLNQITPIEFIPEKPGIYTFACGMNMFRGVVEVQASKTSSNSKFSAQVPV